MDLSTKNLNWIESNGASMSLAAMALLPKADQFKPTPKMTTEEEEDDQGPAGPKPVIALIAKRNVDVWIPVGDVDVSAEEIEAKYAQLDPRSRGSIDSRLWLSLGQYIEMDEMDVMDEETRDLAVEAEIAKSCGTWINTGSLHYHLPPQ